MPVKRFLGRLIFYRCFPGNPVCKRQLQYLFKGTLYYALIHCSEWKLFSGVFPHLKTSVCFAL